LNTQYVKKNVCNEAELTFGSNIDASEHIMDIGEVTKNSLKTICIYSN
jgi:hypothetical protein